MNKYLQKFKQRTLWMVGIFAFAFLGGAVMQLRGALLPNIKTTFQVSESLLGLVAPAGTLGFTLAILATGMRAGKIEVKKFIIIGTLITTVAIFFMGFASFYFTFLLFLVLRGIGSGIFRGLDRPLLNHLFSGKLGRIYNLHAAFWAAGAASGPLIANGVLSLTSNWRVVYITLGVIFIPLLFLLIRADLDLAQYGERAISWDKLAHISKSRKIIGMVAAIFLNGGIEGSFFTWLPYYMINYFHQSFANLTLSLFLAAYVPGRMISSWVSGKISYLTIITFNSAVVAILLVLAFFVNHGILIMVSAIFTGFFISGNFPNLLSFGTEHFPNFSGPINGLAMAFSALGLSIFPALLGVIADNYSLQNGLQLTVFLALGIVASTTFLKRYDSTA